MSDDIVFIKNIDDYNNYAALRPKRKYKYRKVKFICSNCNRECEKVFASLRPTLLCTSCNISMAQQQSEVREKIKSTLLKNYGVSSPLQSKQIKERFKETCIKNYGVPNPSKCEKIQERKKQTCLEKYGVEHYTNPDKAKQTNIEKYGTDSFAKTAAYKEKTNETCNIKYGTDYYVMSDAAKEKIKKVCLDKYGVDNPSKSRIVQNRIRMRWFNDHNKKFLSDHNVECIDKNLTAAVFICKKCNNTFSYSISHFYNLLKIHKNETFCPYCVTRDTSKSSGEKEVAAYVKEIYCGNILENDRTVLEGHELDIYLPELNIAMEYDGTYWHADPRFYESTSFLYNNRTAEEIWSRDEQKDKMCIDKGIKLFRIKEYDWKHNKDDIKKMVYDIINNTEKSGNL